MRSSKSRSRNKTNRNRSSSMGNVVNRVFDSSGPEGKVRGTPQQIIDKYNQLARDAQLAGDRVATENFQQHAEHYLRLLSEAQKEQDQKREEQERQNRERQAERDRERVDRQERDAATGAEPQPPQESSGKGDQPDVLDNAPVDTDSGLVETPENKTEEKPAAKPRRARKPRKKPENAGSDAAENGDSGDNGDPKERSAAAE